MYAILYWEDSTFTVISLGTIISPRKEINEYVLGETVKAKFGGKVYSAQIYEISGEIKKSTRKTLPLFDVLCY
ncbi:hypothetical protein DPMN_019017 [Dreissena polymorpha]|uniref:Uncharacterized protein n=1 Tax=Dreissena polymorpha TaxID=45954 RepID=A0A9D4NE94_DREPO|nr:hypothetical protein DPMN_019017 [Dreissena polymorpha]